MELREVLEGSPYVNYAYAYPHKTAYRSFQTPLPLKDLWSTESRESLFLYLHIPFCEMRCGFCNLFTQVRPEGSLVERFFTALERQAGATREALGQATFTQFALGGGTPTFLDEKQLKRVFRIVENQYGIPVNNVPGSVETSPQTATPGRLELLREKGVRRISLGIQSFNEAECRLVGRPQSRHEVREALREIHRNHFSVLNLDLMYGIPGQDEKSFLETLREALEYQPGEIFLYPLYVRPLTGLGLSRRVWDDQRMQLYRTGRDFLRAQGFVQDSMRLFRAPSQPPQDNGYCCQEDGMVGLGCGARSYTRSVHYSDDYAVRMSSIQQIIEDYTQRDAAFFQTARHGFELNRDEQQRRYILKSLLKCDGLSISAYQQRFQESPLEHPALAALQHSPLVKAENGAVRLTENGIERSDALGPYFFSAPVYALMSEYRTR
jgi:oxygen-independent coproporphyrinogen-3 oxidase